MQYDKPYKYGTSVKIANWHDRMLSYPLDDPNPSTSYASHYRTFGDSNLHFIPKTATQELQESGMITKSEVRQIAKAEINFVSYPMNDFRFDNYGPKETIPIDSYVTTYNTLFKLPKPLAEKIDCCEKVLDPLLNKIPKHDFEMLPTSTNKFMDDHLVNIPEGRKKINFLRQLRNTTHILG